MILETYQSMAVLNILKKDEIYRAKPSISFKGEYAALVDMLGLNCQCPIFTVVKGRKQNTGGRVSASVRLTLNVPEDKIKLTEYSRWADFMYSFKYTKAADYSKLKPDCEEITVRHFQEIITDLKKQRPMPRYKYPQAILEEIRPEWLVSYRLMSGGSTDKKETVKEKFLNIFRK